jgi:hypothetical protein
MSGLNWTHLNNNEAIHTIGLDLGRQQDPSALALLRWCPQVIPGHGAVDIGRRVYEVPTLKRWALQTPYRTIAADLATFMNSPALSANPCLLAVDATGVGDPVYEMIRQELIERNVCGGIVGITITSGNAVTQAGAGRWHVAKRQLVSVLQVLLGNRRLAVAPKLEQAKVMERELRTFSVKITAAQSETFEAWRERDHDDLVLAVAGAAWATETLRHPALPPPNDGPLYLQA